MTEIIDDNVQIQCLIGGEDWLISDAEVELSQTSTPNYVHIVAMVPQGETEVPNNLQELRGKTFKLKANTDLVSERDVEEDSVLFIGKLANISQIDGYAYEGIAYDPSQQVFTGLGEEGAGKSLESGSILNQRIFVNTPQYGREITNTYDDGKEHKVLIEKPSKIIDKIMEAIPSIDEYDNQLTEGGVDRSGGGAYDRGVTFSQINPTINDVLEKIRLETESQYWFDKRGVFHFGVPDPIAHELTLISETSDGASTPAYQSVQVIGSGIVSEGGKNISHIEPAERIIVEGTIGVTSKNNQYEPLLSEEIETEVMPEPVFTYRSNEINTQKQAKAVTREILKDLIKQEADGKITVTGFPEIEPYDVVVMPQNDDPDSINYQPQQDMGGQRYAVYKVVHRINSSDGFKTIIHVSGIVGSSKVAVPEEETPEDSDSELGPILVGDGVNTVRKERGQMGLGGDLKVGSTEYQGVDAFDDVDIDEDRTIADTVENIGISLVDQGFEVGDDAGLDQFEDDENDE